MGIWAYLRHYINLRILSSLLPPSLFGLDIRPFFGSATGHFATVGDFTLDWDTQQYKCWISQGITFALLACLQAVNVFWFVLIVRILWRYVRTGEEKDERSEDEGEEEELLVDGRGEEAVAVDGGDDGVGKEVNGRARKPVITINGAPVGRTGTGMEGESEKEMVRRKR